MSMPSVGANHRSKSKCQLVTTRRIRGVAARSRSRTSTHVHTSSVRFRARSRRRMLTFVSALGYASAHETAGHDGQRQPVELPDGSTVAALLERARRRARDGSPSSAITTSSRARTWPSACSPTATRSRSSRSSEVADEATAGCEDHMLARPLWRRQELSLAPHRRHRQVRIVDETRAALAASGAEIVTVALRRVDLKPGQPTVLDAIARGTCSCPTPPAATPPTRRSARCTSRASSA